MNPYDTITVPYLNIGAEINECFHEVLNIVQRQGGNIKYCWLPIKQDYWWAFVHHAIWETPYKQLVCITPQEHFDIVITERKVILTEDKPTLRNGRVYGKCNKHLPLDPNSKMQIALCKALDEEFSNTERYYTSHKEDPEAIANALDAHRRKNYWMAKIEKNMTIPMNDWLYSAVNHKRDYTELEEEK